jgi:alkanesulfonate monooxygenase SsuD/methylene tetrahydromethanopterin reductase-like flavin-dependent oxidoreductase (luciferase family)
LTGRTSADPATLRVRWGIDGLALGISLAGPSGRDDWARVTTWAEHAETLGLHSVWLPEMHFAPGVTASPLVALAALAARTRRLRLATTSLLLPIHDPIRIAEEIARLDRLSGGRVIAGLGRGFRAPLFAAFGIDPSTKRDLFDQSLERMLAHWAGTSVPGERLNTRPLQQPHPPLAVAAFGRKGLAQAARLGLPYLASPVEPINLIRDNLAYYREAVAAGSDPDDRIVPIMRTVFVSEQPVLVAQVLERLSSELRPAQAGARLPDALSKAIGSPIEDRVIVGNAEQVGARLAAYRDELGMNLLIVRPQLAGVPREALEESLTRLALEVLPAIG